MGRPVTRMLAALTTLTALGTLAVTGGPGAVGATRPHLVLTGPADWTVYHHDVGSSGVDTSGVSLQPLSAAWHTAVDGQLYAEPLETTGRVFEATENDTVYALAADTGSVLWSQHLATPVPSGQLPCGNINPTVGITSTPVIDTARAEIFVVADTWNGVVAEHVLYGLDIYSGAVELDQPVDPPAADPKAILQRASLTLDAGEVIFGYGGNSGDCPTYRGWVMAVPEGVGTVLSHPITPTAGGQGAVWMGGAAPVVDGSGDVWVSSGNGSSTNPADYDGSDSVVELSPSLQQLHLFAPPGWAGDNAGDADLGSASPALVAGGYVVQAGKSNTGYLLNQSNLGGIGGQLNTLGLSCGADVDGGPAVVGTTVYLPCESGIEAVDVSGGALHELWHTGTGASRPPVVADGLVWSINGSDVYGLDPADGSQVVKATLTAAGKSSFPTPSVGDGLLLVPAGTWVDAFEGPGGLPGEPTPPPPPPEPGPAGVGYWTVASDGGMFTFGGLPFYGSMGGRPLTRPVVGLAATPDGHGYLEVASDGGLFAFGDAPFAGSMGGRPLNAPIVGAAITPDGGGYLEVASDGGLFAFGDAHFFGSMGGRPLAAPIVGLVLTAGGGGYFEVASDGGLFAFGDARFAGSMGGRPLAAPIVAMAATPDGGGYYEFAADGGAFTFGDAHYVGSMGGRPLTRPVVGAAVTPDGGGYLEVASDGGLFAFGDAVFAGSMGGRPLNAPMVAIATATG